MIVRPAIVMLAGLCTLSGCVATQAPGLTIEGDAIVLGSLTGIDVRNDRGSVHVVVDRTIPEAIVRTSFSGLGSADLQRAIDESTVSATSSSDNGRAVLRVDVSLPDWARDAASVRVEIVTPECEGIFVQNTGGSVLLTGIAGAIEVHNEGDADSRVLVRTNEDLTGRIVIRSTNGPVSVIAGAGSSGHVTLTTSDGRVALDAPTSRLSGVRTTMSRWEGHLNGGSNEVTLHSDDGEVRFVASEDPMHHRLLDW
ncbi:MAG: hypothetical protein KDA28_09515 [Phycisphaerales bacterium]|nr:hypothetical protein [Phycisphaerales bacterium]